MECSINTLKKELKNLTRGTKTITSFIEKQPIDIPFHNELLEQLVKQHPTKGKIRDIDYLIIRIRPPYNGKALYIKNKDDKPEDDVSYKSCLRNLFGKFNREKDNDAKILHAFRHTISETKRKDFFLNSNYKHCEDCGLSDTINIDHFELSFQQILDEFIFVNNIDFCKLKVFENNDNLYEFEDKIFQEKWVQYHDTNAIFRFLCKSCNASNGSYGYKKRKELYKIE
jgi:hypothetical protein